MCFYVLSVLCICFYVFPWVFDEDSPNWFYIYIYAHIYTNISHINSVVRNANNFENILLKRTYEKDCKFEPNINLTDFLLKLMPKQHFLLPGRAWWDQYYPECFQRWHRVKGRLPSTLLGIAKENYLQDSASYSRFLARLSRAPCELQVLKGPETEELCIS